MTRNRLLHVKWSKTRMMKGRLKRMVRGLDPTFGGIDQPHTERKDFGVLVEKKDERQKPGMQGAD